MARQSISWLERNVEKLALICAGSVLLVTVFVYGVRSPNTLKLDGQSIKPSELKSVIEKKAEAVQVALREASLPELATLPDLSWLNPALPKEAPLYVPLNAPVPKLADRLLSKSGHLKLAEILPPTRPIVTTGKAAARIPPPQEIAVTAASKKADKPGFVFTNDWHWVTAAAVISRSAQLELFLKASYDPRCLDLIVADIEAEREVRLAGGNWSRPEIVKPYAPSRLVGPRTIQLIKDKVGYAISREDCDYIINYRRQLSHADVQADILRVPFQALLAEENPADDDRFEWTVPATLKAADGVVLDLMDPRYGLVFPEGESWLAVNQPANEALGLAEMRKIKRILDTGWKDVGLSAYVNAATVLRSAARDQNDVSMVRRMAMRLLDQHQSEIRPVLEMYREMQHPQDAAIGLGSEVEPIWITDTTVVPGKTYRYRLRLLVLNAYAGQPMFLEKPLDAAKVIVEGEWSPWSEAVAVPADRHLFVLDAADEAGGTVRVQLFQWSNGLWYDGSANVAVGDSIAIRSGGTELTYSGVVQEIDFHRRYFPPNPHSSGAATSDAIETVAVTLVDDKGNTEEHLAAVDRMARADLLREIRAAERRRRSVDQTSRNVLTQRGEDRLGRGPDHAAGYR